MMLEISSCLYTGDTQRTWWRGSCCSCPPSRVCTHLLLLITN